MISDIWDAQDGRPSLRPEHYLDPRSGVAVVRLLRGECLVTSNPGVVFSTVVGSCVAACISDREAGIGGINHFALPHAPRGAARDLAYGDHALDSLIDMLLDRGARPERLEAKLFGGGCMQGSSSVGDSNVRLATSYLMQRHIPLVSGRVGGNAALRVHFAASAGVVRVQARGS